MGLLGCNPIVSQGGSAPWRRDDEQAQKGTLPQVYQMNCFSQFSKSTLTLLNSDQVCRIASSSRSSLHLCPLWSSEDDFCGFISRLPCHLAYGQGEWMGGTGRKLECREDWGLTFPLQVLALGYFSHPFSLSLTQSNFVNSLFVKLFSSCLGVLIFFFCHKLCRFTKSLNILYLQLDSSFLSGFIGSDLGQVSIPTGGEQSRFWNQIVLVWSLSSASF